VPLYTYVVIYKGDHFVAQAKHSNFLGFVSSWTSELPAGAMPSLTGDLRKELAHKAYRGEFGAVPNRRLVWRKIIDLGGSNFTIYAVQTDA
jgi:hypothetical protein